MAERFGRSGTLRIYHRASARTMHRNRSSKSSDAILVLKMSAIVERATTSMGPRSFERGNRWLDERRDIAGRAASMGPRSFERGNRIDMHACVIAVARASMGPRSFERGNRMDAAALEMRDCGFNGAALVRARKSDDAIGDAVAQTGFNGAALVRARKYGRAASVGDAVIELQWGRARSSAEIDVPRRAYRRRATGFNGAALVRARKSSVDDRLADRRGARRFNGAALVRARKSRVAVERHRTDRRFNGAALVRARK